MGQAGCDRRAKSNGRISNYEALERCHDVAACACNVAVAQCAEKTETRPLEEKLAEEENEKSKENEEHQKFDTAEKLAEEHERRLRSEAEIWGLQMILEAEEGWRRPREAKVAMLTEDICIFLK